ncbi:hypothetical protein J7K74_03305 [Candidatus Woesearchaeota archaeon]|nr:hypothetical protein [Candidatus Woesearchaeota archaeon]
MYISFDPNEKDYYKNKWKNSSLKEKLEIIGLTLLTAGIIGYMGVECYRGRTQKKLPELEVVKAEQVDKQYQRSLEDSLGIYNGKTNTSQEDAMFNLKEGSRDTVIDGVYLKVEKVGRGY